MTGLILKRASASRLSGEWNDEDVLCESEVVGRIMKAAAAPVGQPWLWTLAYGHHEDRTPTHGYEPTREAAMAIASTPCSALPATTWALATMRTSANYSLWMVGRQASMAGRPACRIYPERGWRPW